MTASITLGRSVVKLRDSMANSNENQPNQTSQSKIVAEIVSIGDEISTGAILDTNSQYLSQSLSEVGVRVLYHSTVGDDANAMIVAIATAIRRADVVVITGGLGPTQDDLTRQTVADVLGVALEFDQNSLDHVTNFFSRRGRQMPESNKIQAYFPKGSHIIHNPNGTAPGFFVDKPRSELPDFPGSVSGYPNRPGSFLLLSFPGVPAELKEMWGGVDGREAVIRFVSRVTGGKKTFYRNRLIHTFGAGESAVESKLPNLIARDRFPLVGITAKNSVITLRIFAEGSSDEECAQQIEELSNIIYSTVGDFVFGEDDDTFPGVISHNLRAQCRTVGVFEWGTRGTLAASLDSDVLAFGRTFGESDREVFVQLFGDSSKTPEEKRLKSVNQETFGSTFYVLEDKLSSELLELCKTESRGKKVDYFLAVGPFPDVSENAAVDSSKERETVDVAFVDFRDDNAPTLRRETFLFGGHPAIRNVLFGNQALDLLRRYQ